ncbi:MAG: hypothetical protein RSF73_10645, partial [Ruthenibacterium sp.]
MVSTTNNTEKTLLCQSKMTRFSVPLSSFRGFYMKEVLEKNSLFLQNHRACLWNIRLYIKLRSAIMGKV